MATSSRSDAGPDPASRRAPLASSSLDPPRRWGYVVVLALVVLSYALCAMQSTADPSALALMVQLVTVAVTLWVAETPILVRRIAWSVLGVAGAATLAVPVLGTRGDVLDAVLSAASVVAFLAAPAAIIAHQTHRRGVDLDALLAAVSAYLMIGMAFTFAYNLIGLLTHTPVFGPDVVDSLSGQLFFSFTTLTTVGYGNLVPAAPGTQAVSVAEAITGQLFLIVAVARIITAPRR
jgi:hypothetical protein